MNDKNKLNFNSNDKLIDDLLDKDIPAADDNARKVAINLAKSMFETQKNEAFQVQESARPTSIWASINVFFHSLNNNKAFAGVAVLLACVGVVSLLPTSFHKQEIQQTRLVNESEYDYGPAESSAMTPNAQTMSSDSALARSNLGVNLEEIVVSGARESTAREATSRSALPSQKKCLTASVPRIRPAWDTDTEQPRRIAKRRIEKTVEVSSARIKKTQKPSQNDETVAAAMAHNQNTETELAHLSAENQLSNSSAFIQNSLNSGQLPAADSVSIDGLLNYFGHAYPSPSSSNKPLKATIKVVKSPWSNDTNLIYIGIQAFKPTPIKSPDEMLAPAPAIAKDLTLSFAFNSQLVRQHRLLSHPQEPRFNEFKAGHSLTLIYEISMNNTMRDGLTSDKVGVLEMRYTLPSENRSTSIEQALYSNQTGASNNIQFSIAVASFALKLKGDEFADGISYKDIALVAKDSIVSEDDGRQVEFIRMLEQAQSIDQ